MSNLKGYNVTIVFSNFCDWNDEAYPFNMFFEAPTML
jgi:hypothetical protein